MSEVNGGRRAPRKLSAEQKWEVFLQVTSKELTQAEAARKWRVDVSTVIGIRRTVKDAALAALSRPWATGGGAQLIAGGRATRSQR